MLSQSTSGEAQRRLQNVPDGEGAQAWKACSRTICRLAKSHCFNKDALDRIVGTPTNPKPDGAARDPQVRRQHITQRWVDKNGVTPGCPLCEGRGTMSHSETCRKRFDAVDKQVEEATRNARWKWSNHWHSGRLVEPRVLLDLRRPVRRRSRCQVPVLMRCGWSSQRVRSLAGMLLFDANDTSV